MDILARCDNNDMEAGIMVVSWQFINKMVMSYHASFMGDNDWCSIATLPPVNGSYFIQKYQKLYALRFLPAYYFEYCALADALRLRLGSRNISSVNVASFGCGLAPDYYALKDNLQGVSFTYVGIDQSQWPTQGLMPAKGANYSFKHDYVYDLTAKDLKDYDVFVFPKSIRDIYESKATALSSLAKSIASSPKKRLFFLNSFVCTKGLRSLDADLFNVIHDRLVSAGFVCQDNNAVTSYLPHPQTGDKFAWLATIDSGFYYPNAGRIVCASRGKKSDCGVCNVVKSPIFSNEFMDYQFLEYVKV